MKKLTITPEIHTVEDEEINIWESDYSVIEDGKVIKNSKGIGIGIGGNEYVLSREQVIILSQFLRNTISKEIPVKLFENAIYTNKASNIKHLKII